MADEDAASFESRERVHAGQRAPLSAASHELVRSLAPALLFVLPLALALAVYWPYLDSYFAMDDFVWLRAVQAHSLAGVVQRAFTFPGYHPFDSDTPYFRPAADVVFKLEYMAFELDPAPYHIVNLLLHATAAGLGGLLFLRLTRSLAGAAAAGALFSIAPSYEFAATWISQVPELLGAVFALSALLAFHRYLLHEDERWSRVWLAASGAALVLATMSKESQIIVAVLLPALAFVTPERRRSPRSIAVGLAVVAAFAGAYGVFVLVNEVLDESTAGSYEVGLHAVPNTWRYLKAMSLPVAYGDGWADALRAGLAAGYLGLGVAAIGTRRWSAAFFFGWSILAVLPFSFFDAPIQRRYTYLPMLPFLSFLAACAVEAHRAAPARARAAAVYAVAPALVAVAVVFAVRARDEQWMLSQQAAAYRALVASVEEQCSASPPGTRVYVVGDNAFDPFGVIVPATVNVVAEDVYVTRLSPPAEPPSGATGCVVRVRRAP